MTTKAFIKNISTHLPDQVLDNRELEQVFPEFPADKIYEKTGIKERRVAAPGECASDLAVAAARKLFEQGCCRPEDLDYLLFCSQTPDHILPTTACLLQERLGLPRSAGALDFNLGCSGYVYGLGLAKGLIETGQASRVLLLTADTYSKLIHPLDRSVRTLFGDGASATLVCGAENAGDNELLGPFLYGTDGRGGGNLIVRTGGFRAPRNLACAGDEDGVSVPVGGADYLYMDGPEIFSFTLKTVPSSVRQLLSRANVTLDDIDLFVFHQANRFMLEHLRNKLQIHEDRFVLAIEMCGNTVSSTIPIAMAESLRTGQLRQGYRVMLVGFGVGYSWAAGMVKWQGMP